MKMKKLLVAVVLALGGVGSLKGAECPLRPAGWDDLFRASCTVYLTNYPFASGVLLGVDIPNRCPQTYLLTAAHVVNHVIAHKTNVFRIASVDEDAKNATVFEATLAIKKCRMYPGTDLCSIDITDDIIRYVNQGNEFTMQYISVNAPNIRDEPSEDWWCGVARYGEFKELGIRLGSPCKWLGSHIQMWERFYDKHESSLCVFDGAIAALPRTTSLILTFPPRKEGCRAFVTTVPSIHGMSGGPVFAMGKTDDGRTYPYLIGIGVSQMYEEMIPLIRCKRGHSLESLTNYCAFTNGVERFYHTGNDKGSYVCPLDPFLDELRQTLPDVFKPHSECLPRTRPTR